MSSGSVFGYDGKFIKVTDKVFNVIILSLFWIIGCIPILTIGVSTAATYATAVKVIKQDEGYLFEQFVRSYRQNLKDGIILEIIFGIILFILRLNISILSTETSGYMGLFFICLYFLCSVYITGMLCYVFPALSRYDMSAGWMVKISMYMTGRYFLTTIMLIFITISTVAITMWIPYLILIMPGITALLHSEFLERVLKKHEPATQEEIKE